MRKYSSRVWFPSGFHFGGSHRAQSCLTLLVRDLACGMGLTVHFIVFLSLSWLQVWKPFENFCSINLSPWLTYTEDEISKTAWQVEAMYRISDNRKESVRWECNQSEKSPSPALFDQWVASQIFNWSCMSRIEFKDLYWLWGTEIAERERQELLNDYKGL